MPPRGSAAPANCVIPLRIFAGNLTARFAGPARWPGPGKRVHRLSGDELRDVDVIGEVRVEGECVPLGHTGCLSVAVGNPCVILAGLSH